MRIRPARLDELEGLARIEHEADSLFVVVGVDVIVAAPSPAASDYATAQSDGRILVADLAWGTLAGFVRIEIVDAAAHLEQVSVPPEHARRGIGRALIGAAEEWASRHGHTRMTLTTYRDVPWNGPLYHRLGFEVFADADLGPQLRVIRHRERAAGLEVLPRQAMVKRLTLNDSATIRGAPSWKAVTASPQPKPPQFPSLSPNC